MTALTRRNFLIAAAESLLLIHTKFSFAGTRSFRVIDLHTHPGMFMVNAGDRSWNPGDQASAIHKTVKEMKAGGLSCGFFSLVGDLPNIKRGPKGIEPGNPYEPGAAWKEYERQLKQFQKIQSEHHLKLVVEKNSIPQILKSNEIFTLLAVEGGDFLEDSTERVEQMYRDGVRSIQLVHYVPNSLGDLQTAPSVHGGLSKSGKEVVKKMNQLGMIIDVAHADYLTTRAVCELTDKPVILSHSILQAPGERPLAARAIHAEHAKLVSSTGGLIGVWPSGYNRSLKEFAENTMRTIDVAGVDHVGLGTDMDGNFNPVLSSYLQLEEWAGVLTALGLNQADLEKVLSGNALRILQQNLK